MGMEARVETLIMRGEGVAIVGYRHKNCPWLLCSEELWKRKVLKASRTVQYKGVFKFSWALLLRNKSLCSLKPGPWRVYFMSSTLNYFHSSRTLTK